MDATNKSFIRAIVLALLAGLGALPTAFLMIAAVIYGHRLDVAYGTSPAFLLLLLCLAVPFSIFTMLMLARIAVRASLKGSQKFPANAPTGHEEDDS
jgi:hypothetical protein